jgi:predicted nucleic acid-binding protein
MSSLCDTKVLAELARPRPNRRVLAWAEGQRQLTISVITLEEIWYGLSSRPSTRLSRWFEGFFDRHCVVLPVDEGIARAAGELRGRLQGRGRPRSQSDMLIAATAKQAGLAVATRNVNDFDDCGVRIVNPWSIEPD